MGRRGTRQYHRSPMRTHPSSPIHASGSWLWRIGMLATAALIALHVGAPNAAEVHPAEPHAAAAQPQPFDRQLENQRYQQWLDAFRQDLQTLRQSPDPANADIDALFAKTLVPGSRATQVVKSLVQAPGASTHGEIRFVGILRVFLGALSQSVVAGDGGVYPDTQDAYKSQTLRVRYMHVDGGGRLERYFNNPEIFNPYRLPDPGVFERNAYPFLLFEDSHGSLRLGGVSKEFWDLVKFMDALQYA